jgi:GNAT superfamily N-acetyltransferase
MTIRSFRAGDTAGALRLWKTVFGDDDNFILRFLGGSARGFVADEGGVIAAAAYIVDGISLGGRAWPYIYAVATLPEFRGQGLGAAVSLACAEQIELEGGVAALRPAEPSLFDWYARLGFTPAISVREAVITPKAAPCRITPLSPSDYAAERRAVLDGTLYADFDPALFKWWSDSFGGRFAAFDGGCAAYVPGKERCFVAELLSRADASSAVAALAGGCDSLVRTPDLPDFFGWGKASDFIAARGGFKGSWWGLVFD